MDRIAEFLKERGWIPTNAFGLGTGPWIPPFPSDKSCYATPDALRLELSRPVDDVFCTADAFDRVANRIGFPLWAENVFASLRRGELINWSTFASAVNLLKSVHQQTRNN